MDSINNIGILKTLINIVDLVLLYEYDIYELYIKSKTYQVEEHSYLLSFHK